MSEILPLPRETYSGYSISYQYESTQYYDVRLTRASDGMSVDFMLMPCQKPFKKKRKEMLYAPERGDTEAYGMFDGGTLVALIETAPELWSNRLRVLNLWVKPTHQRRGIGRALMAQVKRIAKERKFRAIVLETQTSNTSAIAFYRAMGFTISGFDLFAYTNTDAEKCEVRLDMTYLL